MFFQCFTSVSPVFHQCYTSVTLVLHQFFTRVSLVLHRCYSSVFQCFTWFSPVFHKCFTSVSPLLHYCFTCVSKRLRIISKVFQSFFFAVKSSHSWNIIEISLIQPLNTIETTLKHTCVILCNQCKRMQKLCSAYVLREGVKNTQRGGAHKSRDLRSPICDPP